MFYNYVPLPDTINKNMSAIIVNSYGVLKWGYRVPLVMIHLSGISIGFQLGTWG